MNFPSKILRCGEKQLLVCCARTSLTSEIVERIRELAAAPLDWDYVLSQTQENSIVSLVERNLRAAASELVPEECAAQLKSMARANALRCLACSAELIRVMHSLDSREIAAIPYKGPVAAAQAYGDITARQFEDLDVILRQRDIESADDIIRGLGYAAKIPWAHSAHRLKRMVPGEYNYFHSEREMILELHTELTLRHFPVPPELDTFFERAAVVDLGGRRIRTFCPEDVLVALCVHGAKDFWEKLIWIADVAELIGSFPALDWDLVQRTTEKVRAQRMLGLGLALAGEILDAKIPTEMWGRVESDSRAVNLAGEIAKRHLTRHKRELSASKRFEFRRRVVPGTVRGWRYAMRLTLAPAEEDWQGGRLPDRFAPLYVALRPIRLLRKYGWSGK